MKSQSNYDNVQSPWMQKKRLSNDRDESDDKENHFGPTKTAKVRKTTMSKMGGGCIPIQQIPPERQGNKSGMLLGCFSFRKNKSTKIKTSKGAKSININKQSTIVQSRRLRCARESVNATYATVYPVTKMEMDNYVSIINPRKQKKHIGLPLHIYENVDVLKNELKSRMNMSASLSSQQYSASLNDDIEPKNRSSDLSDGENKPDRNSVIFLPPTSAFNNNLFQSSIYSQLAYKQCQRAISITQAEVQPSETGMLSNMSCISPSSSICCPAEQMSTATLSQATRPLLHSTYNYPLHSTIVNEMMPQNSPVAVDNKYVMPNRIYESLTSNVQRQEAKRLTTKDQPRPTSSHYPHKRAIKLPIIKCKEKEINKPDYVFIDCLDNETYLARTSCPDQKFTNEYLSRPLMSRPSSSTKTSNVYNALSPVSPLKANPFIRNERVASQVLVKNPLYSESSSNYSKHRKSSLGCNTQNEMQCKPNFQYENQNSKQLLAIQRLEKTPGGCHQALPTPRGNCQLLVNQRKTSRLNTNQMKAIIQSRPALFNAMNQRLAPPTEHRKQQQEAVAATSVLDSSFISNSTFATVTKIDNGAFDDTASPMPTGKKQNAKLLQLQWQEKQSVDNRIPSTMLTKQDESSLLSFGDRDRTVDEIEPQILASSNRNAYDIVDNNENHFQAGKAYDTYADDFSRRLKLFNDRYPLIRTSTKKNFNRNESNAATQADISECSTCLINDCRTKAIQENNDFRSFNDVTNHNMKREYRSNVDRRAYAETSKEEWFKKLQLHNKISQFQENYIRSCADAQNVILLGYC